ncbi:hypothetical protein FOCC_FOCC012866 [Frankliniella occidentalis]|nr:hypothetical protein FOCC_FOCC012866 [Frankliniella occidentalis]
MKLLKPKWVTHENDSPIFSIDIHPDGSRFATGGQGLDSGKVVIWNMAPVVSKKAETDENIPKMLCQMDNHEACVNCVRWSHSGRFLASGGDDKLIMVWKINQYAGGNTVFGTGGGIVNVESWRCSSTLRGHEGDVLDLAWSTHDAWLASCSVDNTVIVWNALKLPETIAVLKGHTGLVKGVTWDPVGKYLASQSEDRTLRIWRTVDWKEEQVIKEPFEKCSGSTHVLRLNWSPDGEFLVSAHAMNGPGPTAQIIQREGWTYEMDFVGHRQPVTCVRFNSVLFRRPSKKASQYSCVCAIGSRDQSISIWLTSMKRPLVVIRELFSNSVLDVSWNSNGNQLMACSWDGSVAYIELSEEEFGKPLTKEEKISLQEKKFGKSLLSQKDTYVSRVVETPALLQLQNKAELKSDGVPLTGSAATVEDKKVTSTPIKGPISKQIETRTSDGRRRITPMDVPQPFNASASAQPTFSSAESKSQIVVEKREDVVKPNVATVKSPVKDGPVVNGHAPSSSVVENTSEKPSTTAPVSTPFAPVSFGGKRRTEKEKEKPASSQTPNQASQPQQPKRARFSLDRPAVASLPPTHTAQDSGPLTGRADGPGIFLPPLKSSTKLAVQVESARLQREAHWVEVENAFSNTVSGPLSRLKVIRSSAVSSGTSVGSLKPPTVLWDTVFGCPVIGLVANASFVCVALEDATLQILDFKTGWRSFPPLVLSAQASRLSLNVNSFFMVVTACGQMSIWDLSKSRKVLSNESLLPIMTGLSGSQVTLLSCSLSQNNIPLVSLSTGKAFTFSLDMGCWMQVGNSRSSVTRNSAHQSFLGNPVSNGTTLPLTCLQADIRSCGGGNRLLGVPSSSAAASVIQPCSLAFLDEQLSACKATSSPQEYQYWLLTTVRFLVHNGLEERLRLICNDLLGPIHMGISKSKTWDSHILGVSKHSLLKQVLEIVSSNLRWQRLWTEYTDQIQSVEEKPN